MLWGNDNKVHTTIRTNTMHYGELRSDHKPEVLNIVLAGASHVSFNIETNTSSQQLQAFYTRDRSYGGRSTVTLPLHDPKYAQFVALWFNTCLGFGSVWLRAGRQQSGRALTSRAKVLEVPIYPLDTLTDDQLACTERVFEAHADKHLFALCDMAADDNRIAMEHALFTEVLGCDAAFMEQLSLLRRMISEEPSIHGNKRSRLYHG